MPQHGWSETAREASRLDEEHYTKSKTANVVEMELSVHVCVSRADRAANRFRDDPFKALRFVCAVHLVGNFSPFFPLQQLGTLFEGH